MNCPLPSTLFSLDSFHLSSHLLQPLPTFPSLFHFTPLFFPNPFPLLYVFFTSPCCASKHLPLPVFSSSLFPSHPSPTLSRLLYPPTFLTLLLLLFFSMRRWRFSSRRLASSTSWCWRHLWKFSTTTPTNILRTKKLTIKRKEMK